MKVISFEHQGRASYGVVGDGGVIDAGAALKERYATLRALLEGDALGELAAVAEGASALAALDEVSFLPVIPDPGKIILVGLNYESHRLETGRPESPYPSLFSRTAETLVGHGQPMVKPRVSDQLDFEGEFAIIIGRGGRDISEADALERIAGYSCLNDGSVRDWQRHTSQWLPGKNFVGTGGFGPWMVTSDELTDPTACTLVTRLNGEEVQRGATDDFIYTIPFLMNYISTFTTLQPGDVISTGTPGGVGFAREPQLFMKAGDVIEVEISGIGTLTNPIVAG
ncbi:MAG: fumarylacetoacetate hydrolase family protein [Alphaproteobacteria bacterium]